MRIGSLSKLMCSGLSFGVAAVVVLSCGGGDTPPPVVPVKPVPTVMPPDTIKADPNVKTGVEKTALDPSTPACDDFYQYACGGWIKATEIPGDEASWYRSFSVIHDRNEEILHQILEGYAKGEGSSDPYAKQLGDFYGACMDEAGIEKAGTKQIEPWLKAIEGVNSPQTITKLLGRMQSELGDGIVFQASSAQDFNDATQVVGMLWQAGLGMPEREYYLESTPKMTELRNKYETHVAAIMQLGGQDEKKAKASAKKVIEIETTMAKAWMTKEDRREPKKINHRATRADLPKVAPKILWDVWLDGAKGKDVAAFNVAQPDFMKALGAMLGGEVSINDWKTYLRWHFFRITANDLGQKFVDEKFRWKQALTGAEKLPARWK